MPVLVHVLGAADLGTTPPQYPERLAAVASASLQERIEALTTPPAGAPAHHGQAMPIDMAVHHAVGELGVEADEPWTVLAVATRQDPPHPGDTAELAAVLQDTARQCRDRDDHELFMVPVDVEVATLDEPRMEVARDTVLGEVARLGTDGPFWMILGGGPTGVVVGTALALLESAGPVTFVQANRQDRGDGEGAVRTVSVEGRPAHWLARTRRFDALAALLTDAGERSVDVAEGVDRAALAAQARMWAHLDRLDWTPALEQAAAFGLHVPTQLPRGRAGNPAAPGTDPERWQGYRQLFASALVGRLAYGRRDGLYLLRPWVTASLEERITGSEQVRDGFVEAVGQAQDPAEPPGLDWEQPGARVEKLMRTETANLKQEAFEALAPGEADRLKRDIEAMWDRGAAADHLSRNYPEIASLRTRLAPWIEGNDDLAAAWLRDAGFGEPDALIRQDQLVLLPVGKRSERADGTMPVLDELVATLQLERARHRQRPARAHLRLLCTPELADSAHRIAWEARRRGFASARALPPRHVADLPGHAEAVRETLTDGVMSHTDEILAVAGPGSKAMSVAMLAAVAERAFERVITVRLLSAVEAEPGSDVTPTEIVADEGIDAALRRLGSDALVGKIVEDALPRLDYGLVVDAAGRGSTKWSEVAKRAGALQEALLRPTLVAIDFETLGLERVEPDEEGIKWLAVARLELLRSTLLAALWDEASPVAVAEPLRCLYTAYAVCDWVRFHTDDNRSVSARSRALSRMRNQSPLGHHPEAHDWPLDAVDEAIRTAQDSFDIEGDRDALLQAHLHLVRDAAASP